MLLYFVLCYDVLYIVTLCCVISLYVILSYVVSSYVALCCVMYRGALKLEWLLHDFLIRIQNIKRR